LTQILKPALLGDGKLIMLFCAAPSEGCLEETVATLKFAERAQRMKGEKKLRLSLMKTNSDKSLMKAGSEKKLLDSSNRSRLGSSDSITGEKKPRFPLASKDKNAPKLPPASTPLKSTPNKRRSNLVVPSPYKRYSKAEPGERRATLSKIPMIPAAAVEVVAASPSLSKITKPPSELSVQDIQVLQKSVAEKSAKILCLEARLEEAERKLETAESLRLASPLTQTTVASSEPGSLVGAEGGVGDVVNIAHKHAADELADGRAKIEELERLVARLRGEHEGKGASPALDEGAHETPRRRADARSPKNENTSLLGEGRALDFGAAYATFEGSPDRGGPAGARREGEGETGPTTGAEAPPSEGSIGGSLDERFGRILDLVGAAMDVAAESERNS